MPKKSVTPKPTRSVRRPDRAPVVKLSDPGELVSMIPYVLGFAPTDCLVLIALQGDRRRFGPCLRMDLVDDPADCQAQSQHVLQVVDRHGFDQVVLVAFCARRALADQVVNLIRQGLAQRSVAVVEALRADGRRWWSYECRDVACCSPEGNSYDPDASLAAAEAVLHGLTKAPDRESLRALFAPAAEDARRRVARLCRAPTGDEGVDATREVVPLVQAAVTGATEVDVDETVALVLAVQDVEARDAAWALVRRDSANAHFELWRQVMRLAPDELMPPVGSLAAFSAWLCGHGVLASHALDRVAEVDASYSMARLLRTLLDLSINPEVWEAIAGPSDGVG